MIRFCIYLLLLSNLGLLFFETEVFGHRLNVYAILSGSTVEGEGTFGRGSPCKDCDVVILDSKGKELSKGKTDQEGRFRIALKSEDLEGPLKVILDGGAGHRAEWMIDLQGEAREGPSVQKNKERVEGQAFSDPGKVVGFSESEVRALIQEELQKALEPIRKELIGLHGSGPGISEIIGGLGYIFGIACLVLYLYGRKRYTLKSQDTNNITHNH